MQRPKKDGRTAKGSCVSQEIDSLPVLNKSKRSSRTNLRLRYSPAAERSMQKRVRKGPSLNVFQPSDLYEFGFFFLVPHSRIVISTKRRTGKSVGRAVQLGTRQNKCAKSAESLMKTRSRSSDFLDWCTLASPIFKLEEREFVVDFGAFVHMMCKSDLNSSELETVQLSRGLPVQITTSGSIEKNEEAVVCVRDWDLLVTKQLHEDTPSVLLLDKLSKIIDSPTSESKVGSWIFFNITEKHFCHNNNYVSIAASGLSGDVVSSSSKSAPVESHLLGDNTLPVLSLGKTLRRSRFFFFP